MIGKVLNGFELRSLFLAAVFLTLATFNVFKPSFVVQGQVLGAASWNGSVDLPRVSHAMEIETTTAFSQKEVVEYETIPFETSYEENDDLEYGKEEVLQMGADGIKTLTYLLTYWGEETIDKNLVNTEIEDPIEEIISKGMKVIWRTYETSDVGGVKYWYKFEVWATKYDGNCVGCLGRTFSGTKVRKGVCAVDPSVIPLGTNFYVDGYGLCRAEDIGGSIKGDAVDLGFEDASKSSWGASWTTVYLLTNAP